MKPFERTYADDLLDEQRAADPTPHSHFHTHGGSVHVHEHRHSEEVAFPHAHSARTDLPAHDDE